MSELIIMMGIPNSGKSTYAKYLVKEDPNIVYVSRDEIRFSIIKENEEYFSHEKEVFKEFIHQIDEAISANKTVIADATHLNKGSRSKLLNALKNKPNVIKIIYIKVPLKLALKRNEARIGTRTYVPQETIKNMYNNLKIPDKTENIDLVCIFDAFTNKIEEAD